MLVQFMADAWGTQPALSLVDMHAVVTNAVQLHAMACVLWSDTSLVNPYLYNSMLAVCSHYTCAVQF